jgi:hypothetical protein
MGIEESKPISTGVAPSRSRKLTSSTPPVILEKIVANTPSRIDAVRLVRILCLITLGVELGGHCDGDIKEGLDPFRSREDELFTLDERLG